MKDFEVHVGFADKDMALNSIGALNESQQDHWKMLEVSEVIDGAQPDPCLEPHDVPGGLVIMATTRMSDLQSAIAKVDHLAQNYQNSSTVRIELEQVLLTQVRDEVEPLQIPDVYEPTGADFQYAILLEKTPKFEVHFTVSNKVKNSISQATSDIVALAHQLGISVDQTVRFFSDAGKEKVIMTVFFDSFEKMNEQFGFLFSGLQKALKKTDENLRLKGVAERIIAVAKAPSFKS